MVSFMNQFPKQVPSPRSSPNKSPSFVTSSLRSKQVRDFIFYYDKKLNNGSYYDNPMNNDDILNGSMFTQTQADAEPVYLSEEMEPEEDFVEFQGEMPAPAPTQIEFGQTQSQSLFPTESQLVRRILSGRKTLLTNELDQYNELSATCLATCKF